MNLNSKTSNVIDNNTNKKHHIVWVLVYILITFLSCVIPSAKPIFLYAGVPLIFIMLFFSDDFKYLAFPVCLFESVWGNIIFGRIGILTIYMLVVFVYIAFKRKVKFKLDYQFVAVLLVVSYCLFSYVREGGNDWIRMACYAFIIWNFYVDEDYSKKKLMYVILCSAIAMAVVLVFGLAGSESFIKDGVVGYRANGLGYADPNYSSFVCCLGACVALCLPKFKYSNLLSIGLILMFALAILSAGSRGSFIILFFILFVKLILTKGAIRKLLYVFLGVFIAFLLVVFVLPRLELFSASISRLMTVFSASDAFSDSGRTSIVEIYLEYFKNQNIFQMLFGGNVLQSKALYSSLGVSKAAHNLYLDYLMAFGGIGSIIMLAIHGSRMVTLLKEKDIESQCIFLMKVSALAMSFSLSFFTKIIWWYLMFI